MAKDSIVNFRIDSNLKENAQETVKKLGFKNLSSFLREYIEELSDLNNKNVSDLDYLFDFYTDKLKNISDPGEAFFIKRKLTLIKEFREVIENDIK